MAIVMLADGGVRMPNVLSTTMTINFDGAFYLNGTSTTRVAWMFQAPAAGDLEYAEWYVGFAGGAAAVKVSFQDVDAAGSPDGGADYYRVIAAPTTGWQSQQLTSDGTSGGTKKTVTLGQWVALVFEWNATQSGFYELHGLKNDSQSTLIGSTYGRYFSGGVWTASGSGMWPNFAVRYTDGSYYPVMGTVVPVSALSTDTYNSGSTPDERGTRIVVGAGVRVIGAWFLGTLSGDADVVLYDSDGTSVLVSRSIDKDYGESNFRHYREVQFAAAVTLAASLTYRLTLKPTTATSVTLDGFLVPSAGVLDAHPCGSAWHYTQRTDAGAWTDTPTKRPFMGLIVDGVDSGGVVGASPRAYAFVG